MLNRLRSEEFFVGFPANSCRHVLDNVNLIVGFESIGDLFKFKCNYSRPYEGSFVPYRKMHADLQ